MHILKSIEVLDKKYRYAFNSLVISAYSILASVFLWNYSFYVRVGVGILLLGLLVMFAHYPNVGFGSLRRIRNTLMVMVLPLCLFGSTLLALKYYPNLSLMFKLFVLLVTAGLFYIVSVVDNIFLVVSQREETIPLYRAAVPWSQILIVVVAIPLFAGVFKIPTFSYFQVVLITFFSIIFSFYQFWTFRHDVNVVPVGTWGRGAFAVLTGFFVFCIGIATSFITTESFLRGLNVSAALMFGLVLTGSFLKNNLNKKVLLQYFGILFGFVVLSFVFA